MSLPERPNMTLNSKPLTAKPKLKHARRVSTCKGGRREGGRSYAGLRGAWVSGVSYLEALLTKQVGFVRWVMGIIVGFLRAIVSRLTKPKALPSRIWGKFFGGGWLWEGGGGERWNSEVLRV